MPSDIFSSWQSGAISHHEAMRRLLSDLGEVESQIAPLEAEKAELRAQISEVLAEMGGRAESEGYRLTITSPGVSTRYDAKEIDGIVEYLQARGEDEIAGLILRARKESARAGQLRIVPPGSARKPANDEAPF